MPHIFLSNKTTQERIDSIKAVFDTKSDYIDTVADYENAKLTVKLKNSNTGFEINTQYYNSDPTNYPTLMIHLVGPDGTKLVSQIVSFGYNQDSLWFDYLICKKGIIFGGYQQTAGIHTTYFVPLYIGDTCATGIVSSSYNYTYVVGKTNVIINNASLYCNPIQISESVIAIAPVLLGDVGFSDEVFFTTVRPPSTTLKVYTATIDGKNFYIPSPYNNNSYQFLAFEAASS